MKKNSILLLEDHQSDIKTLIGELEAHGLNFDYRIADNCSEFEAALSNKVNIILANYSFPQYNAKKALQILKESGLSIPFIIISENDNIETVVDCIKEGASGYVLNNQTSSLVTLIEKVQIERQQCSEIQRNVVIDHLPVGIYRVDRSGKIIQSNPALRKLLNLDMLPDGDTESLVDFYGGSAKWEDHIKKVAREQVFSDEFYISESSRLTWFRDTGRGRYNEKKSLDFIDGIIEDITSRKNYEEKLLIQTIALESTTNSILIADKDYKILWANNIYLTASGMDLSDIIDCNVRELHPFIYDGKSAWDVVLKGESYEGEFISSDTHGDEYSELVTIIPFRNHNAQEITHYIITKQDVPYRMRIANEIEQRNRELALLNDVITSASSSLDQEAILDTVLRELANILGVNQAGAMLLNEAQDTLVLVAEYPKTVNQRGIGVKIPLKQNAASLYVINSKKPLMVKDAQHDPRMGSAKEVMIQRNVASILILPIEAHGNVLGTIGFDSYVQRVFTEAEIHLAENTIKAVSQAIGNVRLFNEIKQRANELESVSRVSVALRSASTRDEMPAIVIDFLLSLMKADAVALITNDPGNKGSYCELANGEWSNYTGMNLLEFSDNSTDRDSFSWVKYELDRGFPVGLTVQNESLGEFRILRSTPFNENERRLLSAVADIVVNAMQRALLHESTIKRMQRLSVLHNIDVAISASFDIRGIISVVIDQVVSKLGVDAADLLLFDPATFMFQMASNRGFLSVPARKDITATDGVMAEFALSRKPVTLQNLNNKSEFLLQRGYEKENFVSYLSVPLLAKGEYKGILEIYNRTPFYPDLEWLEFLETICGQAAIAIDNVSILTSLQRSNFELNFTFDITLENISKMLEKRGFEPAGHIKRILEKTVVLAKALGIHEEEIQHLRRGVFLHDLGKFAVPEYIQLKPGPLNEREWEFVRNHVNHSIEAFSLIAYLRPALEIPYCHHERWDGKGYPRGLSGVEIPLSARVFSVVDVWDCLGQDRPYRKAWSEERILEYLRLNAGSHFDPIIVQTFLDLYSTLIK